MNTLVDKRVQIVDILTIVTGKQLDSKLVVECVVPSAEGAVSIRVKTETTIPRCARPV